VSSINSYALGNDVICRGTFKDADGDLADPTTVSFSFRNDDGEVTTYLYGTDTEIVRDSIGKYHVNVDASSSGIWRYRFFSSGTVKAADEGEFIVQSSHFG
jgi:hypothetical protein